MDGSWKPKTRRKDAHTAESAYWTLVARSAMLRLASPHLPCNQLPIQLNAATWALFTPFSVYTDCSQPGPRRGQSAFNRNALPRLLAAEEEESVAAELIVEAVATIAAHAALNGSHQ